jgi:hypothetical protein
MQFKGKTVSKKTKPPVQAAIIDEDNILEVDLLALEKEWARHPKLGRIWRKKLAKAQLRLDEAKDNHKLVTAKLGKDIRENPDQYDLNKVTDKAVEQYIPMQASYQESLDRINDCKYKVSMVESMVLALEDKRRALENEVKLYALQYFDVPNASPGIREAIEQEDATRVFTRGRKKEKEVEDDE